MVTEKQEQKSSKKVVGNILCVIGIVVFVAGLVRGSDMIYVPGFVGAVAGILIRTW